MAYTALTGTDDITMKRLNSIFAELDASIAGSSLEGEAGENLSQRDMVYLAADGTWYQIDTDATGSVALGAVKGCVVESGGITAAATGTIRLFGKVVGFSGLTAWGKVYASTTAGSYTQTRPNPSDGGGQVAIVEMGLAVSTTEVFINPQKAIYVERETLADNGTLTIEHHADAQTRVREVRAYVATTIAGASLESYSDSNKDSELGLEGLTAAGDSIDYTGATGATAVLGDLSGTEYAHAQSFQTTNGGLLTQFTMAFDANSGSPSGDMTWHITEDNSNEPASTDLATGTHTITASSTNTINLSGVILQPSTKYWLWAEVPAQANNVSYNWTRDTNSTSSYAGVGRSLSTDGGSTWSLDAEGEDFNCSFTLSATAEKDKLAQGFQVTGAQTVDKVRLYLRKVGTPTGTMTLRVETDSAGDPSGTLADANATVTVAESSLATSYGYIEFDFSTNFSLSGSTQYHLVLSTDRAQSDTNYVAWGADGSSPGYTNGEGKSELASTWSSESVDFVFDVVGPATDYDEPLGIGSVTGDSEEVGVRFDDGAGTNDDTQTTFKNLTGASADICCEVVL